MIRERHVMRPKISAVACIMLLMTLLLQGCGHKGPLFLPQQSQSSLGK